MSEFAEAEVGSRNSSCLFGKDIVGYFDLTYSMSTEDFVPAELYWL